MEQDPLRPGMKTSEFLGVVVSMAVSTAVLFKLLPAEQAVHFQDQLLQFISLCVQLVTTISAMLIAIKPLIKYIESRTSLKTTALQYTDTPAPAPTA